MRIGPDNYRSVMYLPMERLSTQKRDKDIMQRKFDGRLSFLTTAAFLSHDGRVQSSTCRERY